MITPFIVDTAQPVLNDLRSRIINTRWPDAISGKGWATGTSLNYLKELTNYWSTGFDWRKAEATINAYPNFIATIDDYTIHFLHIKGKGKKSIPLIITHGWPGSFIELIKIIPLLTEDPDTSFDLVVPSVIGFGFSGNSIREGCNSAVIAELWHKLMMELGYQRYGAQSGDIGAGISTWLSLYHPANVIGLHLNFISGSYQPYLDGSEGVSEEMTEYRALLAAWLANEGAYASLHSTKPLTLAYGLQDSPVGLCAWIIEKFNSWSDNGGYLENVFTKDELLKNITLYWITGTIHSSVHLYYENSRRKLVFGKGDFVSVPVAYAKFPRELPTPPRSYIEKGFNLQRWTEMPHGGHFAAMEQPDLLAADIRAFFNGLV